MEMSLWGQRQMIAFGYYSVCRSLWTHINPFIVTQSCHHGNTVSIECSVVNNQYQQTTTNDLLPLTQRSHKSYFISIDLYKASQTTQELL